MNEWSQGVAFWCVCWTFCLKLKRLNNSNYKIWKAKQLWMCRLYTNEISLVGNTLNAQVNENLNLMTIVTAVFIALIKKWMSQDILFSIFNSTDMWFEWLNSIAFMFVDSNYKQMILFFISKNYFFLFQKLTSFETSRSNTKLTIIQSCYENVSNE